MALSVEITFIVIGRPMSDSMSVVGGKKETWNDMKISCALIRFMNSSMFKRSKELSETSPGSLLFPCIEHLRILHLAMIVSKAGSAEPDCYGVRTSLKFNSPGAVFLIFLGALGRCRCLINGLFPLPSAPAPAPARVPPSSWSSPVASPLNSWKKLPTAAKTAMNVRWSKNRMPRL